jgi:hypothetical protein
VTQLLILLVRGFLPGTKLIIDWCFYTFSMACVVGELYYKLGRQEYIAIPLEYVSMLHHLFRLLVIVGAILSKLCGVNSQLLIIGVPLAFVCLLHVLGVLKIVFSRKYLDILVNYDILKKPE